MPLRFGSPRQVMVGALSVLFVLSLAGNIALWRKAERAEERAKHAEARSVEPAYQRVLLQPDDLRRLKSLGLADPVNQLRSDLAAHGNLIPVSGVLGGTMSFYDRENVVLLPGNYVYAPGDDGHILVHAVLRYDVKPGGTIDWKLLDAARD